MNKFKIMFWKSMSNEELLRSANLILTNLEIKREEVTLAAILLFGEDNSIISVLPQYKTDAIFRVEIRIDMINTKYL